MVDQPDTENASRIVQCALAEFAALRNELDDFSRAQRTIMNLNISGNAVIVGFVLSHKAGPQLLLVVPYLSITLGLLYQTYLLQIERIGDYVNDVIRPLLVDSTGDDRVFGWERDLRANLYLKPGTKLAGRLSFVLLILITPAVGLLWVIPFLNHGWYWLAWVGGLALYVLQLVNWARYSRHFYWA
ncbi:hypothetical protein [Nocardia sp. NPDC049149]|uniref:hypothetical protein n=1 Tax=Nocardia sp. NPDC049149 TaxID=3364315 RepID=UPI0037234DEB